MRELSEIRKDIDLVDEKLKALFEERLSLCREISEYKKENDLPIYDKDRETEKLDMLSEGYDDPFMKDSIRELFNCLMEISKKMQESLLEREGGQG